MFILSLELEVDSLKQIDTYYDTNLKKTSQKYSWKSFYIILNKIVMKAELVEILRNVYKETTFTLSRYLLFD